VKNAETKLSQELRRLILADGPLPLDAFWRAAMTTPDHGYYMKGAPIGEKGDFTTAPEISQIFGELIGLWLVEAWTHAGKPEPFALVELGPGRGQLMADALRAARVAPDFLAAARLILVEASPSLRAEQAERLAAYNPEWLSEWTEALDAAADLPLFLIANEFLDALPIRQYERVGQTWRERLVDVDGDGGFAFALGDPAEPPVDRRLGLPLDLAAAPEGAVLELAPDRQSLATAVAAHLGHMDGAALIFDYGHGSARLGDSLQALRGGRPADVLAAPGEADITSHVDFYSLIRAADKAGARAWGPIDQGVFLLRLGAAERAKALEAKASPEAAAAIAQGLRRLVNPLAMGSLFKAVALLPQVYPPPAGFDE